jgi:hypothetical protein
MAESTCFETMRRFCRAVVAVFGKDYLRTPSEHDTLKSWHKMQQEYFLGCLGASIACIGVGRIARLFGKDYTKDISETAV